ncbi:putative xylose-proton symporter [Diplonema papillatum]|nr:putative xylose-proton symporter [Diplonema papillatum]
MDVEMTSLGYNALPKHGGPPQPSSPYSLYSNSSLGWAGSGAGSGQGVRRRPQQQQPQQPDFPTEAAADAAGKDVDPNLNDKYRGMSEQTMQKTMKWVVYLWSATQLFGTFAMPAWIAVFATQWYTSVNLVPGEVALVVTISKCVDVLTDPLMASYLRKCTMHKIANIMVLGSFIQFAAFAAMFFPFTPLNPTGGRTRVLLQYGLAYMVFYVGDTLTGTPTTTLGTMLKSQKILDETHHNDGLRIGSMMKVVGILLMGTVTLAVSRVMMPLGYELEQKDGVMSGLYPRTNFICALFFGTSHFVINLAFRFMLVRYRNSTVAPAVLEHLDKTSFLQQFSELMTSSYNNPFFRQLIGAWVCDQLTITLMKNLLMWFVRHKVEPEIAKGCAAYDDPINARFIADEGFESGFPKSSFECKSSSVAVVGVFFVIIGAIMGNVFWQKKLDREKDRYGNRNVYHNWLLFNLSSALTNGLMVFVGRGDNRLFWFLCFINGLPIGGEFMTDTILLFLIASETWLSRTDRPLTSAEEGEQLDSHTTKFGMMKTFIPKAVSLIAEALPLALIQIWYTPYREICLEADPPITDLNSIECANFLSYNDTGDPKFIPQKPQVADLISFFFFILPTLTCLLSYHIKSKFQVTDTGELVMLSSIRRGAPSQDSKDELTRMDPILGKRTVITATSGSKGSHQLAASANTVNSGGTTVTQSTTKNGAAPLPAKRGDYQDPDSQLGRISSEHVAHAVQEFSRRMGRQGPMAPGSAVAVGPGNSWNSPVMTRGIVETLVHQLEDACNFHDMLNDTEPSYPDFVKAQSVSSINLPRPAFDPWLGGIVPTTHGQHMFRLPYFNHTLSRVPLDVLMFATREQSPSGVLGFLKNTVHDSSSTAALKGVTTGFFLCIVFPSAMLATAAIRFVEGLHYFARRCIPGFRDEMHGSVGSPIHLFGILGRRSLLTFTDRIMPILGSHVISPNNPSQAAAWREQILSWLSDAKMASAQLQNDNAPFQHREARLLQPTYDKVVFPLRKLYLEDRISNRILYLECLGFSFMVSMMAVVIGVFVSEGTDIIKSEWSIIVTVPLFLAAMGLICGMFFHGLHTLSKDSKKGDGAVIRAERVFDGEALACLSVIHFNSFNSAGSQPLIFSDREDSGKDNLLGGLHTPVGVPDQRYTMIDSNSMSYVLFVPSGSLKSVMRQLEPVHHVLDQVQEEANKKRREAGYSPSVRWGVSNIVPPEKYPPYRVLLYYWEGVPPPYLPSTKSSTDRRKV